MQLNIGLNTNTGSALTLREALCAVALAGSVYGFRRAHSETEQTLVVHCAELDDGTIFGLSELLQQDCIAALSVDGDGALIGPKADAWGTFNPEFFINY